MNTELSTLIADYLNAKAAREKIDAQLGEISELILSRVAEGEKAELEPGVGIRVQRPNRRFDQAIAIQILTPEQIMGITTTVIDREKAKDILPGALYDQCTRPVGQPSVRAL